MWYSFRGRKLPVISPLIYYFTPYNKKTIGSDFFYFHVLKNEWNYDFILDKDMKKAGEFMFRKLLKDRYYTKKHRQQSQKIGKEFIRFCKINLNSNFDNKTDKQLIKLLNRYRIFYENFSLVNITPWIFLPDKLSSFLLDSLSKIIKTNANDIFILLSTPNFKSYTKKEELDILSSAIKIRKGKSNVEIESEKLSKKYFWIPFDYLGLDFWDEKYYANELNNLLKSGTSVLNSKIKKSESSKNKIKIAQSKKIKELKLSQKLINLFEALKDTAVLQDDKKSITTQCHYYLQNLYKEMAKRRSLDFMDFYSFTNEEIKDVLLNRKNMGTAGKDRKIFSAAMIRNGKIKIMEGDLAQNFIKSKGVSLPSDKDKIKQSSKEIKGVSAAPGKVSGKVRILLSSKEVNKMERGEILVAAMTTPDYVPAMRRTIAIITDEGGITSHAAIMSRELKIPCIVGTKIATQVLKDGDLVEVDANKGIVKILK